MPKSPLFAAASAIYENSFGIDDRLPQGDFEACAGIGLDATGRDRDRFWVFGRSLDAEGAPQVEGFAMFDYMGRRNLAYMSFFAVRGDVRGGGIGAAAFGAILAQITQDGQEVNGKPPDGLFWEVHPPDDPRADAQTQAQNQRRIAFYARQGGVVLPILYRTPSPTPTLPYVDYSLMFAPIGLADAKIGKRSLRKIAHAALVDVYELPPDHEYVQRAYDLCKTVTS